MKRRWLLGILLLVAGRAVLAQEGAAVDVRFDAEQMRPLVGEPVHVTLSAVFAPGHTLVSWPEVPEQWGVIEVRQRGELEITQRADGGLEYQQSLTLVLWEPGEFETPETVIVYQPPDAAPAELVVAPLRFQVPSVLKADDLTLRPLKPQVSPLYVPPVLVIGVAGVLLSAAAWAVDRRRNTQERAQQPPTEAARAVLAALKKINPQTMEPALVYAAAADCLRDYLARQFGIAASELTTSEMVKDMQPHLPKPLLNGLYQLLNQADLVKFARQTPDVPAARQYLDMTARWIQAAGQTRQRDDAGGGA